MRGVDGREACIFELWQGMRGNESRLEQHTLTIAPGERVWVEFVLERGSWNFAFADTERSSLCVIKALTGARRVYDEPAHGGRFWTPGGLTKVLLAWPCLVHPFERRRFGRGDRVWHEAHGVGHIVRTMRKTAVVHFRSQPSGAVKVVSVHSLEPFRLSRKMKGRRRLPWAER